MNDRSHLYKQKQVRRDGVVQDYHRKKGQPLSKASERRAVSAAWQAQEPGDWSTYNAPAAPPETFWGRVKREWAAVRAHARDWADRMAERAAVASIERDARHYTPPSMTEFERQRFVEEGEVYRETLEWRRKTGRNMLTGEHLSGMPIDRFDEFPENNPYNEDGTLKFGRRPLDEEEGRPHQPKKFDPYTRKYLGRLPKGADPYRDPHGRDADGWLPNDTHCGTGSRFGRDGLTRVNKRTREQHFREVILKGLTPEEAAAHRAEVEQHEHVMALDAQERAWAEKYAVR